jgi:predicted DNA-binding transcriptional regulator YafY
MLDAGRCIPREQLRRRLEISPATLKRDIAFLRERLNVPLIFDRDGGGYRIDPSAQPTGTQYELPGLWLSAEEIHALLTMQHVLANLDTGGLLGPHIEPLIKRLTGLLGAGNPREADVGEQIARRIRVQTVGARRVHLPHFQAVGPALLRRKRLVIDYHARGRDQRSERKVSPQRLIHYRDNWYLDAWCHLRRSLRSFSVDAIANVRALNKPAIDVPEGELDDMLGAGYGIFAGRDVQWATLRFSAERSRWVAAETWHPQQRGRFDQDGQWVLELPYADPRKLVMDILRHVPEVEVLGPQELRKEVSEKLKAGAGRLTL